MWYRAAQTWDHSLVGGNLIVLRVKCGVQRNSSLGTPNLFKYRTHIAPLPTKYSLEGRKKKGEGDKEKNHLPGPGSMSALSQSISALQSGHFSDNAARDTCQHQAAIQTHGAAIP